MFCTYYCTSDFRHKNLNNSRTSKSEKRKWFQTIFVANFVLVGLKGSFLLHNLFWKRLASTFKSQIKLLIHSIEQLELRQHKNGFVSVNRMLVLKLPPFFHCRADEGKRAANSKQIFFSQKRVRSYIVLALVLYHFIQSSTQCFSLAWILSFNQASGQNRFT